MCKHKFEVIKNRYDCGSLDPARTVVSVPMTRSGCWVMITVDPADDDGLREVRWKGKVFGYVRQTTCRLDLRMLAWPFIFAEAMNTRCHSCGLGWISEGSSLDSARQQDIIASAWYIWNNAADTCPADDDSDLIPPAT